MGPHDVASLGVYEYLHDVLAWQEPTQPMRGLWKIAKSAGWFVPHEHVCWISERPRILRTDARGRLHCPDGPALQFALESPAGVVADDQHDGKLVANQRIHLRQVKAERAIAGDGHHPVAGMRQLQRQSVGQRGADGAERSETQPSTGVTRGQNGAAALGAIGHGKMINS